MENSELYTRLATLEEKITEQRVISLELRVDVKELHAALHNLADRLDGKLRMVEEKIDTLKDNIFRMKLKVAVITLGIAMGGTGSIVGAMKILGW
jgi:uncharacterized coiled-coil protein SlyX